VLGLSLGVAYDAGSMYRPTFTFEAGGFYWHVDENGNVTNVQEVDVLFFESNDCTGPIYASAVGGPTLPRSAVVVGLISSNSIAYRRGALRRFLSYKSIYSLSQGSCSMNNSGIFDALTVLEPTSFRVPAPYPFPAPISVR
jgi:hypothetical protein